MSSVLFAARRLAGVSTRKVRAGRAMEPAHVSQSHPPAPSGPCSIGDATATSSTSTRTQASSPWGIPATRTGTEPRPGPSWEPGRRLTSHVARGSTASRPPSSPSINSLKHGMPALVTTAARWRLPRSWPRLPPAAPAPPGGRTRRHGQPGQERAGPAFGQVPAACTARILTSWSRPVACRSRAASAAER
jgi:hypothetical protein